MLAEAAADDLSSPPVLWTGAMLGITSCKVLTFT